MLPGGDGRRYGRVSEIRCACAFTPGTAYGVRHGARPCARKPARGFPEGRAGGTTAGDLPVGRWPGDPWPAVSAEGLAHRPRSGADLLPRRLAPADVAGLALHVLLQQRVRAEPIFREP